MGPTLASIGSAHPEAFEEACEAGPEGKVCRIAETDDILTVFPFVQNLPENQCLFIRGFRVTRVLVLGILRRQFRGAAGPNPMSLTRHLHRLARRKR